MPVTLGDEDARALARALDNYLPELRFELSRVKLEHERLPLVRFEERLTALRRKLL